jgi:hypothetical protein
MKVENVRAIGKGRSIGEFVRGLFHFSAEKKLGRSSKVLHGVRTVKLHAVQGNDGKGEPFVIFAADLGSKMVVFPEKTWDDMGLLPGWLEPQVFAELHPVRAKVRDTLERVKTLVA